MSTYTVIKPLRGADGKPLAVGQTVELTARQAKWLLLSGKIAAFEPNKTAPAKAEGKQKKKEK